MSSGSLYHEGERFVQQRTHQEVQANRNARVVSDRLSPGIARFIAQQSMIILGSVGADKNVWASVLFGLPGFVSAADDRTVEFDLSLANPDGRDSFWSNVEKDPSVGMLAIDLASRGRLRVNGRLRYVDPTTMQLDVAEAYPNCPKYIQSREITPGPAIDAVAKVAARSGDILPPALRYLIGGADTFFVASAHTQRGVDVSHRGGDPGFIEVLDERTLRIPDYMGNGMFNTLGNFIANPRAGLLFIDFDHGGTVQLIGRPKIQWELDRPDDRTGGTRRYWDFIVERWVERALPHSIESDLLEYSPFNPTPQPSLGGPS